MLRTLRFSLWLERATEASEDEEVTGRFEVIQVWRRIKGGDVFLRTAIAQGRAKANCTVTTGKRCFE